MSRTIEGVLPIVNTPFLEDDTIDYDAYKKEIDWIFELGCEGFGMAMVSEFLRLTTEERIESTYKLSEINNGRGVFVGAWRSPHTPRLETGTLKSGCLGVSGPLVSRALGGGCGLVEAEETQIGDELAHRGV